MLNAKKLLFANQVKPLRPQDVFATSLYPGNGGTQTITNGLDLAGKGGLVWVKNRSAANYPGHILNDSARGPGVWLGTDVTNAEATPGNMFSSFNGNGFSLLENNRLNQSGVSYVSWSFRRAKKFFDIVPYTGNGVGGRQIPHGLGDVPGMIIIKRLDAAASWLVHHRMAGVDATGRPNLLFLNTSDGVQNDGSWATFPTATYFTVAGGPNHNANGGRYVAYLFAHNPDLIDCGLAVGDGSSKLVVCGNGWTPQLVLWKRVDAAVDWQIVDTSRGFSTGATERVLYPNLANAEQTVDLFDPTTSGFRVLQQYLSSVRHIYLAIRAPT